jgi:hypothetical protein
MFLERKLTSMLGFNPYTPSALQTQKCCPFGFSVINALDVTAPGAFLILYC